MADNLKQTLTQVRGHELAVERDLSATATALEQTKVDLEELERDIKRELGTAACADMQQTASPKEPVTAADIQILTTRLASIGEVDPLVLKEYEEVSDRYTHLTQQLTDIEETAANTTKLIKTLKRDIEQQFRAKFAAIQQGFTKYFQELFDGGTAQLQIIETTPDEESGEEQTSVAGIDISVHPPGKKLQHIGALSGGEKALTSLALLLAIIHVQKPPFLVLDEVDAALDEANSYRFAKVLHTIRATTQVIVVTHNRETMGSAGVLYGITMGKDGASQMYSVNGAPKTPSRQASPSALRHRRQ